MKKLIILTICSVLFLVGISFAEREPVTVALTLNEASTNQCYYWRVKPKVLTLDNTSGTSTFTIYIDGSLITSDGTNAMTKIVTSGVERIYTLNFPFTSIRVVETGGTGASATVKCYE